MAGTLIVDGWKLLSLADIIANFLQGGEGHLYTNNYTPVHGTVIGDFTEAAFSGYANQALTSWSSPALDGSFHAFTTADPVQFANTSGSGQVVYGYFLTDINGDLIGGEKYASPITIPDGLFLQETFTFTDQSEF